MAIRLTTRITAAAAVGAVGLGVMTTTPAIAAPGDWVNLSGVPAGSRYPEVSTSARAVVAMFGNDVQVAWSRRDDTGSSGLYTAILDKAGTVKTASTPITTGWASMNAFPQLLTYQGQRAASFGADRPGGPGRGQNLATSPDGITWTVNPGSLSVANRADVSAGGGTVNTPGETLIWAGAPNMGAFVWHVGLSSTNPATGSPDQTYQPPTSGTSGVNVAFEPTTGITYGTYYIASRDKAVAGTHVAQIHPTYTGFTQVPGSFSIDSSGNAQTTSAGDIVPFAARPQGGVYVGYIDENDDDTLKIREVGSGKVMAVPGTADAESVSLSAGPNGRLWVTFEKGSQMYTAQTDPGAKAFGSPAVLGNPQRGATIYGASIGGDSASAYVAVNVYAADEQNIYGSTVLPNLTVAVVGQARKGGKVKVRVLDGGAPVRNAKVIVGGKTLKSKAGGVATFTAPRSSSVKVVAKGPGYTDGAASITLR